MFAATPLAPLAAAAAAAAIPVEGSAAPAKIDGFAVLNAAADKDAAAALPAAAVARIAYDVAFNGSGMVKLRAIADKAKAKVTTKAGEYTKTAPMSPMGVLYVVLHLIETTAADAGARPVAGVTPESRGMVAAAYAAGISAAFAAAAAAAGGMKAANKAAKDATKATNAAAAPAPAADPAPAAAAAPAVVSVETAIAIVLSALSAGSLLADDRLALSAAIASADAAAAAHEALNAAAAPAAAPAKSLKVTA